MDFAGEVVKTGELVTKYRLGDNVFGFASIGTFQEYTITKEKWIHIMPDRVQFQQIAGLPLVGVTSYQALTYFLQNSKDNVYKEFGEEPDLSGKNILIVGVTGGCGHIAVQIAKFLQANELYGVCSLEKVDLIKNLKICEDVLAYDALDFQNALESILLTEDGQPKLDLIFDTVSSPEAGDVGAQYMKYLKPEGKYVSLNSKSYWTFFRGLLVSLIPSLNFEKKGTHCHMLNRNDEKGLDVIYNMILQGKIEFFTNNIVFDYEAIENGIKMLKSRKTTGKIICNIINDENIVI
jgi:alcohol dehydrogenase